MSAAPLYLVLDLETPGLDPELGILEVAWMLTDDLAKPVPVSSALVDVNTWAAYRSANDTVRRMHLGNGLWRALQDADEPKFTLLELERLMLAAVTFADPGGMRPLYLVGNSIRLDRAFIARWMPKLDARLHYRQIDLTAVRLMLEAAGAAAPEVPPSGALAHRAADDVRYSAALAAAYAAHLAPLAEVAP